LSNQKKNNFIQNKPKETFVHRFIRIELLNPTKFDDQFPNDRFPCDRFAQNRNKLKFFIFSKSKNKKFMNVEFPIFKFWGKKNYLFSLLLVVLPQLVQPPHRIKKVILLQKKRLKQKYFQKTRDDPLLQD